MTDANRSAELMSRLRELWTYSNNAVLLEAADALEAQTREIERLKGLVEACGVCFQNCQFDGPPPSPWTSWYEWVQGRNYFGVKIERL